MSPNTQDIAIVGIELRVPGAENADIFWHNISNGIESISRLDDETLIKNVPSAELNNPNYVNAKGLLKDSDLFAADFFDYTPKEAMLMDPQQRVLLEMAYKALEESHCSSKHYQGEVGTFVSAGFNTYLLTCIMEHPEFKESKNYYSLAIGNGNDFLATRIAYKLNLTGPAQAIQTACSSSLTAVHQACQSLWNYECDAAIAGGVSITTPLDAGYLYKQGGIGSPDGHCRPFDTNAKGTVPGNGAGIVILKRLEDAVTDGNHIYATVKSSAINNDGNNKVSYTAPSANGQANAIELAQGLADITPESISYIEAHGTGTSLGDPIEFEGLKQAFGNTTPSHPHCAVGSVKANIGHLDSAAGIIGFIKTALMLHHQKLPPQINYDAPNPRLGLEHSNFYINQVLKAWPTLAYPRRAGVSSFGIGGTNAHVILEECPEPYRNIAREPAAESPLLKRERYWIDAATKHTPIIVPPALQQQSQMEMIEEILCDMLGVTSIDSNKTLENLGMDSMLIIDFIIELETHFQCSIATGICQSSSTVSELSADLSELISTYKTEPKQNARLPSLAVEIKGSHSLNYKTLWCIHPAGGLTSVFQELANQLSTDVRVIGIRGNGWDGKSPADTDITRMAQRYIDILKEVQERGPYYLCGSSLGGTIAYEIAQQLSQQGEDIQLLAMIDSPYPNIQFDTYSAPETNAEIIKYIDTLCSNTANEFRKIKAANKFQADNFINVWKTHSKLASQYTSTSYVGNVVYFQASQETNYLPKGMAIGWLSYIEAGIEIHETPGNHISMHHGKGAQKIAAILNNKLKTTPTIPLTHFSQIQSDLNAPHI